MLHNHSWLARLLVLPAALAIIPSTVLADEVRPRTVAVSGTETTSVTITSAACMA
jgi:hypothetical protein